ncbi:MAG TPA: biotin--[acetyl-CoA-carboxylase] ligase [Gemmatimonadaceae bacterium]|nr:biotin--[acetyl-CoA-carboxylase] ligase [Gemmatimonadaceae bacterium]
MTTAADAARAATFDGVDAATLAVRLGVPRVELWHTLPSTQDAAHEAAAAGAPGGTIVLADAQTAGRGRGGHQWASSAGAGVWLTMLARPTGMGAAPQLSLRIGLRVAEALDALAHEMVRIKWPNDLYLRGGKVGGILVEARWRDDRAEWVAAGLGLNVRVPHDVAGAASLPDGTSRVEVLERVVPAIGQALRSEGVLSAEEREAYAARDVARGRRCRAPVPGCVVGIAADGALIVRTEHGERECRAGSLVFEEDS